MSILIIDDDPTSLLLLSAMARQASSLPVVTLTEPAQALAWCAHTLPSLVLVDYRMEDMNGIAFIARFRQIAQMAQVPIIMITSENERSVRQLALATGATDFLAKPIDTSELRLRLHNLLALSQANSLLAQQARQLQAQMDQAAALSDAREQALLHALVAFVEPVVHPGTARLLRVAAYVALMCRQLNLARGFAQLAGPAALYQASGGGLHAQRLSPLQRALHCFYGAAPADGKGSLLLQMAQDIAIGRSERFDGNGPRKLAGCAIPMAARIVAVADAFDTLVHARALALPQARTQLQALSGKQLCPLCTAALQGVPDAALDATAPAGATVAGIDAPCPQ
jgi:response regulator RpfG family c-di-GMP phosphodiesterase